jgi:hypothetical protein
LLQYVLVMFGIAIDKVKGNKETDIRLELSAGLIDFTHALFMLVSARLQTSYLPQHSLKGNCSQAYNVGVPNGESSFFTLISIVANNGNGTSSGAADQCEEYEAAALLETIMG